MFFGKVINIHVIILLFCYFSPFKCVIIRIYLYTILLIFGLHTKYSVMQHLGENVGEPLKYTVLPQWVPSTPSDQALILKPSNLL